MKNFDKFIFGVIFIYFIVFSVISVNRYWQYQTNYLDFGIYDEAIWKASRFRVPIVDKGENGRINLADHFTPGMYLLSPVYWFTDSREVMFVLQVLAVSLAAWVGYLIAKTRIGNKIALFSLIVSFLGFVGTQNALITDIHEITYAVLPLMLVFWAIEKNKWKHFFVFLILLLSFKENLAGVAVGIGLYIIFRYRKTHVRKGLFAIIIGLVWGALVTMYVIPFMNQGVYAYTPTHLEGENLIQMLSRYFSTQTKRDTLFYTFSTFGFLPIFDIASWALIAEHYLERFVLSTAGTRIDLGFHYNAIIVPILFMSSLNTLEFMKKRVSGKVVSTISVLTIAWVLIYSRFIYHGPIDLFYNRAFYEQRKHVKYQDEFVAMFPKEGLVLTQNDLGARLTHGPDVRLLRKEYEYLNPDYVILNLTPGQNPNSYYPATYDIAVAIKDFYLSHPDYELKKGHNDQYLFSKKN